MKIKVSQADNYLYEYLLTLCQEIKLVQGGTALSSTLRRHNKLKLYLIEKQIEKIKHIEERYFNQDGTLRDLAIQADNLKSLH